MIIIDYFCHTELSNKQEMLRLVWYETWEKNVIKNAYGFHDSCPSRTSSALFMIKEATIFGNVNDVN